jgi:hypothetical protein
MQNTDFNPLAVVVINRLIAKDRLSDAVFARKNDDYSGLAYYIARALNLDFQAPVKFGLIWAVIDAIDSLEDV